MICEWHFYLNEHVGNSVFTSKKVSVLDSYVDDNKTWVGNQGENLVGKTCDLALAVKHIKGDQRFYEQAQFLRAYLHH